jgi:hypothetical protein
MRLKPLKSPTALAAAALMFGSLVFAQNQPELPAPGTTLSPDQLDDLVAPIALYPDELVSQVLVASTYPLEVVQAYQFLQRNPGLTGPNLTQAAQQQNWDPSVQALVVLPDVLKRLNDDVTWTSNLGNAFLAQQQDVMDAVQRMRAKAQQAGKLQSTPQQSVTVANQGGAPYIEIEPVDPAVIYVPVYDPLWIWGPAAWYPYPRWYWPPRPILGAGLYFGYGPAINVGFFFGGGWHGWGGWGWHPGWGNRTVVVNNTFIHTYNFNTTRVTNVHGTAVWQHDPEHRQGVPYGNAAMNDRYRGAQRQNLAPRPTVEQTRQGFQSEPGQQYGNRTGPQNTPSERFGNRQAPQNTPSERFGNRQVPQNTPPQRGAFGGMDQGRSAQTHAEHGYGSLGPQRSAPSPSYSRPAPAPRSAPSGGGGRRR